MRRVLVGVALVAGVVVLALAGGGVSVAPSALDGGTRAVDPQALKAPGCAEVDPGDLDDRDHLDPAGAPPASELYEVDIPAAGPHFARWSPIVDQLPATPLDVRTVLHNLEHGAVAVWVDPGALDRGTLDFVEAWRAQLGAAGFDNAETGATVFVSPFPGGVDSGAAVALRAWGVAVDCTAWDLEVADAFVGLHYGTRGEAPEAELGPWPRGNGVLVGPPGADDGVTTTV